MYILILTKGILMKKLSLLLLLSAVATHVMGAADYSNKNDAQVLKEMIHNAFAQKNVAKAAQLMALGLAHGINPSCQDVRTLMNESTEALDNETLFNAFSKCMDETELYNLVENCTEPNTLAALKKLHEQGMKFYSQDKLDACERQIRRNEGVFFRQTQLANSDKIARCKAVRDFLIEAGKQEQEEREESVLKRFQASAVVMQK
jgi:hypothetical protein